MMLYNLLTFCLLQVTYLTQINSSSRHTYMSGVAENFVPWMEYLAHLSSPNSINIDLTPLQKSITR